MKKTNLLMLFILINLVVTSCKKTEDLQLKDDVQAQNASPEKLSPAFGSKMYSVRLTDAPGVYGAVWIDLKGVEATLSNGKVIQLNTRVGRYNLRTLTNGKDTLIATGNITIGNVVQLRLILGPNSTVVSAGKTYALSFDMNDAEGLTIPIEQGKSLKATNSALIDFDANQSIIDMGNNQFKLKPVIRNINLLTSGIIKGNILPVGLMASITATSMYGSYSTFAEDQSDFAIMGLPSGKYSITIIPNIPLKPMTINNVMVMQGATNNLGTFSF